MTRGVMDFFVLLMRPPGEHPTGSRPGMIDCKKYGDFVLPTPFEQDDRLDAAPAGNLSESALKAVFNRAAADNS